MVKTARIEVTRREFLRAVGLTGVLVGTGRLGWAQAPRSIAIAHSVSTFVYGQHLVALEKKFFEDEGVSVDTVIAPGGGAGVVQALASGQALFALGDSNHPLKLTEQGRAALMLFATDTRCAYANIVVRRDLHDKGVRGLEQLADPSLAGRRAVIAATAIGAGTWVYGSSILDRVGGKDGKPLNASVKWVGGGPATALLDGLKAGTFDAIVAAPEWVWVAEDEGFGVAIYNILDDLAWTRVFGGPIPVTVGYVLKETVERSPEVVQGYVNACYRAQKWILAASDDEILGLLYGPYMRAFTKEAVRRSIRYYRIILNRDFAIDERAYRNGMRVWYPRAIREPSPYAEAVDPTFVRKAKEARGTSSRPREG